MLMSPKKNYKYREKLDALHRILVAMQKCILALSPFDWKKIDIADANN